MNVSATVAPQQFRCNLADDALHRLTFCCYCRVAARITIQSLLSGSLTMTMSSSMKSWWTLLSPQTSHWSAPLGNWNLFSSIITNAVVFSLSLPLLRYRPTFTQFATAVQNIKIDTSRQLAFGPRKSQLSPYIDGTLKTERASLSESSAF